MPKDKAKMVQEAYDELQRLAPELLPDEIIYLRDASGDTPIASYHGDRKIIVSDRFFEPWVGKHDSVGGRGGILVHEMGHSLEDLMTEEEKHTWSRLYLDMKEALNKAYDEWIETGFKPEEDPTLLYAPSLRALSGTFEDLAETYRVYMGVGTELGHIGNERRELLQALLRRI